MPTSFRVSVHTAIIPKILTLGKPVPTSASHSTTGGPSGSSTGHGSDAEKIESLYSRRQSAPTIGWVQQESPVVKLEDSLPPLILDSNIPMTPSFIQYSPTEERARRPRNKLPSAAPPPSRVRKSPGQQRRLRAALPDGASGLLQYSLDAKSNYENILDGTTSSIFYPDDFSAKVQSKRVAHKISEKARRDRLTTAIRAMQQLLPDGLCKEIQSEEETQGPISKAVVVESAIRYIKQLQSQAGVSVKGKQRQVDDGEASEVVSWKDEDDESEVEEISPHQTEEMELDDASG